MTEPRVARKVNVLVYLPEGMADWEVGFAMAELRTGRFTRPDVDIFLKTAGRTAEAITTMGGLSITPESSLGELGAGSVDALILPGGTTWDADDLHGEVLELAAGLKDRGVPVAAICGASGALAAAGLLNDVAHTSNSLDEIRGLPGYVGEELYRDAYAVNGSNVITAGSWAPVEFAYEIFKALDVMAPAALANWLLFWGGRDVRGIYGLMAELHGHQRAGTQNV